MLLLCRLKIVTKQQVQCFGLNSLIGNLIGGKRLEFTSWAQVNQSVTHSHVQVERPWEMIAGEELVPINSYFHIRNAIEGG